MSGNIRGRFTLQTIEQHATANPAEECYANVKFTAVTASNEDCKTWSKHTPSGELTMAITNPSALKNLEVGKDYFLDISPVES